MQTNGDSTHGVLNFGYYSKRDAERLALLLQKASIPCNILFDRDFSRLHSSATSVHPPLRRGLSFRDVKSGYFVQVSEDNKDSALQVMEGTIFEQPKNGSAKSGSEGEITIANANSSSTQRTEDPAETNESTACAQDPLRGEEFRNRQEKARFPRWITAIMVAMTFIIVLSRLINC